MDSASGCDLFLEPALDGAELCLVDIDPLAVKRTAACLRAAVSQHGLHWKIRVADLDTALKKADLVLVSISTGGFDAMMNDYSIPERFGIYHTVGDTVGPGGISRALRNIPVFTGIARQDEPSLPGRMDASCDQSFDPVDPCGREDRPGPHRGAVP